MHELLQASGYAALVYLLLNYFISFGSGRPLVEAINPNRKYLPIFALGMFGISYSLLVKAIWKYQSTHETLLLELVNEEKAKAEVIGAVSFLVFGIAVLLLYIWCWWNLPRDPKTFSANPKELISEYRRALYHYVRWHGGIDYGMLCEVKSGVHSIVAEGASRRDILKGIMRLPKVQTASALQDWRSAVEEQIRIWQTEAQRIVKCWPMFNNAIAGTRQGPPITICFDVKIGACYIELLDGMMEDSENSNGLYLFAATLNQHEVNTMTAGRHFYSLAEAIRTIRRGVSKH